jgi:hypothetical protein
LARRFSKAWSLGWASAVDSEGRTIWIADAPRDDGRRFIVHADEKLSAFVAEQRGLLEQVEQFEHDHDNDNHSNYVKDVSIYAGDSYQIARAKVNIYPNLSAITSFSLQRRFA